MPLITMRIGLVLTFLGIAGYVGSRATSVTALIPSVFGVILFLLGMMARDEAKRKTAMHIAVVVGVLGFAGSVSGLIGLARMLSGEAVARPMAVISQSIMAVLTGIFVALCVKSFRDARRSRAE